MLDSMIFSDEYTPKEDIDYIFFHEEKVKKLKKMSDDNAIPNLIFYGPEGCGADYLVSTFLKMLYGNSISEVSNAIYKVMGSGNTPKEIPIRQSNFHIEIEPNNNNFDRYLIQDIVKEYARRMPLDIFDVKRSFKTVFIKNIDNMSYYAQTSLRRTLELYSKTCRFIMLSNSLSKVIEPLRSRCYCFRVNNPSNGDLFCYLMRVAAKENMQLSISDFQNIISQSKRNIKKALWLLQMHKIKESSIISYDIVLDKILTLIKTCNLSNIYIRNSEGVCVGGIRQLMYDIMITNICGSVVIKDLLVKLMNDESIPIKNRMLLPDIASTAEHNYNLCRREIIHLEYFVIHVMDVLSKKN